jgi:hypothetical protein
VKTAEKRLEEKDLLNQAFEKKKELRQKPFTI